MGEFADGETDVRSCSEYDVLQGVDQFPEPAAGYVLQLRGRRWALTLGEDRTGFQRGGHGGRILEPEALHEVVDIFLLRRRYGVSIVIARHPYPKGLVHLPLARYPVLLVEHPQHAFYLLMGSYSRSVVDPKGADCPVAASPIADAGYGGVPPSSSVSALSFSCQILPACFSP